jgi:putative FmdB family regulatory protein
MPTYDYVCDACKHAWEEFQPITSKPTRKCPGCGKAKARRCIGAGAGIIFKGSGFYITDYRSDSYKKSADADAKSSSGESKSGGKDSSGSSGGSKSESKSESKSSGKSKD